jgi:outer membrane autotransporter protein
VRNGDVYQMASVIAGDVSDISVVNRGALVTMTASAGAGGLLLNANVVNAHQIPGITKPAAATLNSLLSYAGPSAKVQALGVAVEQLPTLAGARAAAEQLSPSVNGASIQMPLAINNLFASQIFNRLDASVYGALQAPGAGPRDFVGSAAPVYKGPFAENQDEGVWFNVVGSNISQQTVSNVAGYASNLGGFIAGLDRAFAPGLRFGGAIGYATGSAKNSGLAGDSLNLQTVEGMVYGSLIQPNWYLKGTIGVASLDYQSARTIAFPGVYDYASAHRNGFLYSAGIDAGRPFVTAFGAFIPVASLLYAHVDQDGYQEKSYSGAGLNVASQQVNSLQSGLGLKAVFPFSVTPALASALELRTVWRHEFLDTAESLTAAFVGGGSFQAVGPQPTHDLADVGAALRLGFPNQQQSFEVSYNARLGANYTEQVGMLRARYDF